MMIYEDPKRKIKKKNLCEKKLTKGSVLRWRGHCLAVREMRKT
jgi:hypothetical protein